MFEIEHTDVFKTIKNHLINEKGLESCDVFHATRYLQNLNQQEDQEEQMNFLTSAPDACTMSKTI